jgi:hypothetical protein
MPVSATLMERLPAQWLACAAQRRYCKRHTPFDPECAPDPALDAQSLHALAYEFFGKTNPESRSRRFVA